jgi:hypothetical protein
VVLWTSQISILTFSNKESKFFVEIGKNLHFFLTNQIASSKVVGKTNGGRLVVV